MNLYTWDNQEQYGEDQSHIAVLAESLEEAREIVRQEAEKGRDFDKVYLTQDRFPEITPVTQKAVFLFR